MELLPTGNGKAFFLLTQKVTLSTYSRWFQLRILHRILATNTFLYKINITDSNICNFCNSEPETLKHLFHDCPCVQTFWKTLFQWLQAECIHIVHVNPSLKDILFGIIDKNRADLVVNLIILLGKQFIYKCRRNNQQLPVAIQQYKSFLKSVYDTEKYIAFKNCSWKKFNTRWSPYKDMISMI